VTNETLPRPSNWLLVVSVLNIGINLWLISQAFATYVIYSSSFLFWFGIVVGPFWLAIPIQQYRGTFRLAPSAARYCAVMLCLPGCLISLLLFVLFLTLLSSGAFAGVLLFNLPALVAPAVFFGAAQLNRKRGRELDAFLATQSAIPNQRKYSLRELFLAVGVVAVMSGVAARRIHTALPDYADIPWQAEHVDLDAVPFVLPASATDISYSQGYRGKLNYEFTVDEASFRIWVGTQIFATPDEEVYRMMSEIAPDFYEIERYTASSRTHSGRRSITIQDGLAFRKWSGNREIQAAYDRNSGRAYYSARQW